jgi:hypothetical protein
MGRVVIEADPTTAELEAWLDSFGTPRGIPLGEFLSSEPGRLDALLAGLPAGPAAFHWTILVPLVELALQCQRRWVCEGGAWVPTGDTRVLESDSAAIARFTLDGPAISASQARETWDDAVDALRTADGNVQGVDAYRRDCG